MAQENRGWWIILGVLVLVVLLVPTLGGGMMGWAGVGPGMMGWYGGQPGPGGWNVGLAWGLGWLAMLAFWGAVIAGIVLLVRAISSPGTGAAARGDPALDVLRRRYAAGEITQEEYERMRQVLER